MALYNKNKYPVSIAFLLSLVNLLYLVLPIFAMLLGVLVHILHHNNIQYKTFDF